MDTEKTISINTALSLVYKASVYTVSAKLECMLPIRLIITICSCIVGAIVLICVICCSVKRCRRARLNKRNQGAFTHNQQRAVIISNTPGQGYMNAAGHPYFVSDPNQVNLKASLVQHTPGGSYY